MAAHPGYAATNLQSAGPDHWYERALGELGNAVHAKAANRLYDEAVDGYFARHRVKPGLTGWAQINGWRGETETVEQIRKRVEHDIYYIEHWSIILDLRIIARTVLGGFTGRNAF